MDIKPLLSHKKLKYVNACGKTLNGFSRKKSTEIDNNPENLTHVTNLV